MIQCIDGKKFRDMFVSGANNLQNNKDLVDKLNVFPVPDGDTGTNMSLTISYAIKELSKVEDDIANSRKYYNGVVRIYNNKVEMFPSNIFAGLFGYKSKAMFDASANERENVKVEL